MTAEHRRVVSKRRDPKPVVQLSADDAWKALTLVNDWIKHVETKTGATLAVTGVSSGILFNLVKDRNQGVDVVVVLASITGVLLVSAAAFAAMALWPRLKSKEEPTSTLYFHHIARRHSANGTYMEALREIIVDREKLIGEIATQVWANAKVARKKYYWSGLALAALLPGLGALALTAVAKMVWP